MADTLTVRRASAPPAPAVPSTFTFDAIGTRWCIDTDEPLGGEVRDRILDRIRRFDRTYSRFRPDSLVAQVAAAPAGGRFEFPKDSIALFDLYDRLVAATDGAVDPLVGRQLELLGYNPTYSLTPAPAAVRARERARATPTWAADIVRDGTTLITRRPLVIDVGAAGKGYLVDIISTILRQAGVAEFVVDAGGDLRHRGEHGIRVGLEHPLDPRLVLGVANLQNRALCASAVNRRAWGNGLHHVLDARTGTPATEVVATWVVAGDAALADGLATALFFTGAHRLAEIFRFTYVRMLADGRAERSPDFDGELFTRAPTPVQAATHRKAADRSRTTDKEGHDNTGQQDPADDDHRSLCRCGHRRMRDDGRGRHQSIVGLEHQRRRPGFTLQPTLQVRRRHLQRHGPIRQPSLKHRGVRHPRR
jgi:FAD:protein FMN transferase